jgi:hypothetical protein
LLRNAYLIAAALLLLILPLSDTGVALMLFIAVDLAGAAMMLRPEPAPRRSVVPLGGDASTLALMRRTVPDLRMRRPSGTVEAQLRWRETARSHSQRRNIFS